MGLQIIAKIGSNFQTFQISSKADKKTEEDEFNGVQLSIK